MSKRPSIISDKFNVEAMLREAAQPLAMTKPGPHGSCYRCGVALTRVEARDRSHVCAPHPLADVKAFQKRERAKRKAGRVAIERPRERIKPFYVSGFTRVPEGGQVYELRARDCMVRSLDPARGRPNTVILSQFAKYRHAQDVANMLNAAIATWRAS